MGYVRKELRLQLIVCYYFIQQLNVFLIWKRAGKTNSALSPGMHKVCHSADNSKPQQYGQDNLDCA